MNYLLETRLYGGCEMDYILETTDSEKTISLDTAIQGKPTMVVFVRHLG
jgi:hypothetical protein